MRDVKYDMTVLVVSLFWYAAAGVLFLFRDAPPETIIGGVAYFSSIFIFGGGIIVSLGLLPLVPFALAMDYILPRE